MKPLFALAGFVLLATQALAAPKELLYEGYTIVTKEEIVSAFEAEGLPPDQISYKHLNVLENLYKKKGIDFIGLTEARDEACYTIQENPYWILDGYEDFASGRMNKISQIAIDSLRVVLAKKQRCLELKKVGPENYSLSEVENLKEYHDQAGYICPDD